MEWSLREMKINVYSAAAFTGCHMENDLITKAFVFAVEALSVAHSSYSIVLEIFTMPAEESDESQLLLFCWWKQIQIYVEIISVNWNRSEKDF